MEDINNATNTGLGAEEVNETNQEQGTDENLTLTREELNLMLQREADKRVSKALATAKQKWEADLGTTVDSKLKDYERKAQMTPEQLRQAEMEDKVRKFEETERKYQETMRKAEIAEKLGERKLSKVLVDFVYAEDMEAVEQKITTLEQLVLGMVNEQVEQRIESASPKASINSATLDKERFKKLSLSERNQLYLTNPTLYKQLSEGN